MPPDHNHRLQTDLCNVRVYRERQQSPGAVDAQRAALDELVAASRRTPRQSNPSGGSSVEPFLLYVPPGGCGNIRDGEWQAGTTPRDVEEGHLHICVFCAVVSGCSTCKKETGFYCVHCIIIRVVVMACVCNTLTSTVHAEPSNETDPSPVFWIDDSPQISASKAEGCVVYPIGGLPIVCLDLRITSKLRRIHRVRYDEGRRLRCSGSLIESEQRNVSMRMRHFA